MAAREIREVRRPVIERIVINISVVGVETIVTGIGAAVAPTVAVPAGADMALADDGPEIRRY
jgi:hypothetical protein